MVSRPFLLLVLLIVALAPLPASAQGPATGTPPFSSFSGGPDIVNNGNLNDHWAFPIRHKPGRGTDFAYDLGYDSSVYYPVTSGSTTTWQPVPQFGWSGLTATGYATSTSRIRTCRFFQETRWVTESYTEYDNWTYFEGSGTSRVRPQPEMAKVGRLGSPGTPHPLIGASFDPAPDCGPQTTDATLSTNDGSGYKVGVSIDVATTLYTAEGLVGSFGTNTTDRNGNQITLSNGVYTDTLGTTALTVTGTGTAATPYVFTYTAPSGASAHYTLNYTNFTLATNFGVSQINEYKSGAAVPLPTSLVLPDGSRYNFTYEPTPATPVQSACTPYAGTTCVTGRISSVALPTGGAISYVYYNNGGNFTACAAGNNGVFSDGSASCLQRTTPDGTWTYTRSQINYPTEAKHWQTKISTPPDPANSPAVGNDTVISFQEDSATSTSLNVFNNFYETQRVIYQGASSSNTVLRTLTTCYNANTTNCTTTAVSSPITQRNVTDQFGSSGLQCQHNYFYNSAGGLSERDDYDYGSVPGALLRKILITYASLGNITAFQQRVTVCNGSGTSSSCTGPSGSSTGTVVSQTNFNYDENTPATSSGVAQHTSVSGSRGNLTSVNYPVSGLTSHFTYWDTGSPNTSQDINGATTTYNYSSNTASCQMAFPTGITEAISSLTQSYTWNCTGGVMTQLTDENSQVTSTTYNDPYFWRPSAITDQAQNATGIGYAAGGVAVVPNLTFNNNNSLVSVAYNFDGLGRPWFDQRYQSPTAQTWDTVSYTYDAIGRPYSTSMPCSVGAGLNCPGATPKTTQTYDALNRPLQTTDGGGGTVTYTYTNNDVLVTISPAPSGENTKQRQLEYDALGRLTSVCEITAGTTAWPSASCGQNTSATGYLTKYSYDAIGNLTGVTLNAQSTSNQQTRSYVFDAMSRLTSETNPESGTMTYIYDSDSTGNCNWPSTTYYGFIFTGNSPGDLVKKTDSAGNITCFLYDNLHRLIGKITPYGPYYCARGAGSPCTSPDQYFVYDSAVVNGTNMTNVKGRLAEAYTCAGACSSKITDEGLSYTARGEVSDVYQATPNSGGYYHVAQTYWPHGAPSQLSSNIAGLPTISYGGTIGSTVGLDGEGRITQVTAASGQNPVTAVSYNGGSLPAQVNFGSGDNDIFAYDANTMRQTQYQFNVNGQSATGTLTWNANSTLSQLAITDQFNSADTQTCNYSHDDLIRIASANCGAAASQTFSYDPFGNISKSGSPYTFQPTYNAATNRFATILGATPSYDANGNVLGDGSHTYAWDANGNSVIVDAVGLTFDALDRMVEQNRSGSYSQIVYSPSGGKLALMNGQSLVKAFVPLPGQANAVYTSSGLDHYRHSDWLGSARLTSSPTRTVLSTAAYAPFGEPYAQSGTADLSYTGQNSDTSSGDYDFLAREYSIQGRWPSPDPAGLAAVDITNPQSWNRYSYVLNNPLALIDPIGLVCLWDDGSFDAADDPQSGIQSLCEGLGGTWIDDTMGGDWSPNPNADLAALVADLNSGQQPLIQMDVWAAMPGDSGGLSMWDFLSVPWSGTVLFPLVPFGPAASAGAGPTFAYNPKTDTGCYGLAGGAMVPATGRAVALGPLSVGNLGNADKILSGGSVFAGAQATPALGVQGMGNSSGLLAGPTFGTPGITAGASVSKCQGGVGKKLLNWFIDSIL